MKKSVWMVLCLVALCMISVALAGDRGPQKVVTSLPLGSGTVTPPTGDTGRFILTHVIFTAPAATTQTVSFVTGSITNTIGTKVIAANDCILEITNAMPLFSGDHIRISSTALAATNSATCIGTLCD